MHRIGRFKKAGWNSRSRRRAARATSCKQELISQDLDQLFRVTILYWILIGSGFWTIFISSSIPILTQRKRAQPFFKNGAIVRAKKVETAEYVWSNPKLHQNRTVVATGIYIISLDLEISFIKTELLQHVHTEEYWVHTSSPCPTPRRSNRRGATITEVDPSTPVGIEQKVPASVQEEVLRNSPMHPTESTPQTIENSLDEFCKNAQALSNLAATMNKVITIKFMPGNKENQENVQKSADIEMTITDAESNQPCLPATQSSQPNEQRSRPRQSKRSNRDREIYSPPKRRERSSPRRHRGRYPPVNRRYFSHRPCYCRDCIYKSRGSYNFPRPRRSFRGERNPLYRSCKLE